MSIRIGSPGALTTVQDAGRYGYMAAGIGPGGAMDTDAFREANRLVGNAENAAVLEMTLFGITAEFTEDTLIALTGADMGARLDGERVAPWTAVPVSAGQTLSMGIAREGCRTYLAVRGGIGVPAVMGSRSTNLKCRLGGFHGRALKAGDDIPIGQSAEETDPDDPRSGTARAFLEKGTLQRPMQEKVAGPVENPGAGRRHQYGRELEVRVVMGPQADLFTKKGMEAFLQTRYTVTPESDRMGLRLSGPVIESIHGVDIVSDGVTFGSIQVPKNGMPIILMADHQTTGGYAKIATVCSFDLPALAQAVPGTQISFREISVEEAQFLYLHPEERNRTPDLHFAVRKRASGSGMTHPAPFGTVFSLHAKGAASGRGGRMNRRIRGWRHRTARIK